APASNRRKHPAHHGKSPPRRNHNPAARLRFRFLEQHGRDDTISKQDQDQRSEKFTEPGRCHSHFLLLVFCPIKRTRHRFFPLTIKPFALPFPKRSFPRSPRPPIGA